MPLFCNRNYLQKSCLELVLNAHYRVRSSQTDVFDVIYFHDADRIAREVTIQTIIIEEILKHRKHARNAKNATV